MATLYDRLLLAESGNRQLDAQGNPITSQKGAIGAAQIMPTTAPEAAKMAGVEFDDRLYRTDADYNKKLGKAYLDAQLKAFGGDEDKALAAYNAGAGRVKSALAKAKSEGGNWLDYMPEETRNYVAKINPTKAISKDDLIKGFGEEIKSSKPTKQALSNEFASFMKQNPKEKGILDKAADVVTTAGKGALGLGETALTLGTGVVAAPLAGISSIAQTALQGGNVADAQALANQRAEAMTYQPRTEAGQQSLQAVGDLMGNEILQKIAPAVPMAAEFQGLGALSKAAAAPAVAKAAETAAPVIAKAQQAAAPAVAAAQRAGAATTSAMGRVLDKTTAAAKGVKGKLAGAVKSDTPELPAGSIGAAATPREVQMAQTAESLGYTGKAAPTAGQLTGDFEIQRFESEAAKQAGAANELLRQQTDAQNARSFQLLNDFEEQFDPTSTSQANRGEIVTGVLGKAEKADRDAVNKLYKQAEASGALAGDVDIAPLEKYLIENRANAQKASILSNAESLVENAKKLTKAEGGTDNEAAITIKQLEDLRSNIGKNTDWASPDAVYTPEIKRIIDDILDNASVETGGAYKAARSAWKGYKDKYANRELTAKLLGTKRGGIDRRVAMEDVFNESVLKGKKADLVHLMSVLGKAGDDGKQAINELRSGFIEHLRDKAFGNVSSVTAEGLPSISTAQTVKIVRELDKSGKLNVLFNNSDAQKLRDFSEVVQMLNSKRYGAVNTSNTGSVMAALLESGASAMLSGVPIPVMTGIKEALRMKNERALAKAVQRSLDRHKQVVANASNRF